MIVLAWIKYAGRMKKEIKVVKKGNDVVGIYWEVTTK